MIRWRFRTPLIAAALAGSLVIAACSSGGGAGDAAGPGNLEKTNLVVGVVPALESAAVYIAQAGGLFTAEGLHVTLVPVVSAKNIISEQLAGTVDVGAGSYVSYILADAEHPGALKVLAPGSILGPNTQEIVVPPGSPIQTVGELQGKTVGVNVLGNISTLLVDSVLSDSAISNPTQAVRFKAIPYNHMAAALEDHSVDAAYVPEPYVTQAEEQAGAQPLADTDQGASQGLPITGYMVTAAWMKKYPHTAAAFRDAILKAQAIAANDPKMIEKDVPGLSGFPKSEIAVATPPQYATASSEASIQRLANLMLQFGMLNQRFDASQMFQAP